MNANTLSKSIGQKSTVWEKILKAARADTIHLHGQPAKTRALSRSLFGATGSGGRARRSHCRHGLHGLHSPWQAALRQLDRFLSRGRAGADARGSVSRS